MAQRVGGAFVEGKMPGGVAVDVEHGPWTLRLDLQVVSSGSSSLMHPRVWARFMGRDEVRLLVRPKTLLDRLLERLGRDGSKFLDRELARRYVVRGRPEARVRSLLSAGLAQAVSSHESLRLQIGPVGWRLRRALGPHARLLQARAPGVGTEVDRMIGLIETGREALDVLRRTGSASADRPPER